VFFVLDGGIQVKNYSQIGREIIYSEIAAGEVSLELEVGTGTRSAKPSTTMPGCRPINETLVRDLADDGLPSGRHPVVPA
jgi:hypothetical protein